MKNSTHDLKYALMKKRRVSCRGQGMLEYVLVVTVVVAVSVAALSVVTTSCGVLVSTLVDEIESETGVE